jgi:CBS domain-containing protein
MQDIGQLAVKVRVLAPEDSLGRASEIIRASTVGMAPVASGGRLMGMLTASSLAAALAAYPEMDPEKTTVASLQLEPVVALPETISPSDALQFFQANDLTAAPVLDYAGGLIGLISQAELAPAVCRRIKPPLVGGMATPFGVYLTGGGARGGVGDLALMSTGVFMTLVFIAAQVVTEWLLSPHGLLGLAALQRYSELMVGEHVKGLYVAVTMALFGLMFRLTWVTGYHAAEHQVVHALEAGDDLRPEVIRTKPRVHPRCGTNLVVAVGMMSLFWGAKTLDAYGIPTVMVAMLATFLLWRRIGAWVQQHVTTRPANDEQIESGITAGRQLLQRYQEQGPTGGIVSRIWNMGLLQVLGGGLLVTGFFTLLMLVGVPLPPALRPW